jgi:hypothetical protein
MLQSATCKCRLLDWGVLPTVASSDTKFILNEITVKYKQNFIQLCPHFIKDYSGI